MARMARLTLSLLLLSLLGLTGCTSLPKMSPLPKQYTVYPQAEPGTLQTADGLTLYSQWWKPAQEPRAVIILAHGTAAHSGAYAPWAQYLTSQGYALFAFDMRGWGQSQGFGRRAFVRSHDEYVDDLYPAFDAVRKAYPGKPIFLQGESLGASVVMQASIRGGYPVQGLILNAPPVYINLKVGFGLPNWIATPMVWMGGIPGEVFPNYPLFPMQYKFVESWIWSKAMFNKTMIKEIHQEPFFTHSPIAAAYVTALGKGAALVREKAGDIKEPFICLQGDKDHLVSPASSEYLRLNTSSTNKTFKMYQGMSHTTLHDNGRGEVWTDIVTWLDAQVSTPRSESADEAAQRQALGKKLAAETPEQNFARLLAESNGTLKTWKPGSPWKKSTTTSSSPATALTTGMSNAGMSNPAL